MLELQESQGREVARDLAHLRMERQAVEKSQIDRESRVVAPLMENFPVNRREERCSGKPFPPEPLLDPLPIRGRNPARAASELLLLELSWRHPKRERRSGRKGGQAGKPILPRSLVEGSAPDRPL